MNAKEFEDVIPYRGFVEQGIEEDDYDFETWTMIAPEGTYIGTDTEGNQIEEVLDGESLANLAAGYEPDSAFIDKDHESMKNPLERDTQAYGWISELKALTGSAPDYNGLYAKIRWTDKGRDLITSRAYRFMSPAFQLNEFGRPIKLVNSALTNRPNFSLPPIINGESGQTTTTEEHDMDIEALKEEIVNACMERMKAIEAANECGDPQKEETVNAEPETESKPEPADGVPEAAPEAEAKDVPEPTPAEPVEEPKKEPKKEPKEEPVEEVIKPEALNSTSETVPALGEMAKVTEEWRSLKGDALLQWARRHPGA